MGMGDLSADDVIALLAMKPHPEGGHYIETWRADVPIGARACGTAIYFLLKAGEVSRWHRVDAAEIWHWYAGAPLALRLARDGARADHVLGNALALAQRPQAIVPAFAWQSAESLGSWTLVGCTVSPGFQFSCFELAPEGWEPGGD